MVTVTIDPVLIHFGHFAVRWYSIIVLTAILVGLWITGREARRKGLDVDKVYETALCVAAAGILVVAVFGEQFFEFGDDAGLLGRDFERKRVRRHISGSYGRIKRSLHDS